MSGQMEICTRVVTRRVTWNNSALSNVLDVREVNSRLQLELDADFKGSTITYHAVNASGVPIALKKGGSAVTDTVSASARNVLTTDLTGIDELILQSNQTETAVGTLCGSA